MNQIINMIMRMVMNRLMRVGINKGMQAMSKRQQKKPNDPQNPNV